MNHEHKLGIFSVAFVYIGTLVGAGFASGREIWQFFGVFGNQGLIGVLVVGFLFVIMGVITSLIARVLRTNDIGRIIFPIDNKGISSFIGYFMAAMLFTSMIFMTAAAGSLFNQQFGWNKIVGGIIVVVLTSATLIGGFERLNKVFRAAVPILLIIMIISCTMILTSDLPKGEIQQEATPSPMANNFIFAAMIYVSYNMLAVIPIVSTGAQNAKSVKHATFGAALGGVFLGLLALMLCASMLTDSGYSQAMDMPMLALASKVGTFANLMYTVVMLFAIYASATGNFYGFSTKIKNNKYKNIKIILAAIIAFLIGLVGFKNLVAYMLPIQGALGAIIVILLIINFFDKVVFNMITKQEKEKYDFPEEIVNVTTGYGTAALLIIGNEKTALMDCSMAYCGDKLVEKIKAVLGDKPLDYFFASHTHYDHIGALPQLRKAWPNIIAFGAEHGYEVLQREGALKAIKKLGIKAAKMYGGKEEDVLIEGLYIDRILKDGDEVDLGGKKIKVIETPGHTKCSLTYAIEPQKILLASESVGVLERKGMSHTVVLQSFEEAAKSIKKCREYNPERIIVSHYGIVPKSYNKSLWNLFERELYFEREIIVNAWEEGKTEDKIFDMITDKFWNKPRAAAQPFEAFEINMRNAIRLYKPKEKEKNYDKNK